jgi:tRNA 5-methylaminomethyl-2-thiouridine biosynthesis bifunctional protein
VPHSKPTYYDTIVIGGGIAGSSIAYELNKCDQKVLLLEKNSIASGASYAAGAFLSPMIGLPNEIKSLINAAFFYTTHFYATHFSEHFVQNGVNRIPKDSKDALDFERFQNFIDLPYERKGQGYFFKEGGIVDSVAICKALIKDIAYKEAYEVSSISREESIWCVGEFKCKNIVFATACFPEIVQIPYQKLSGIWGERITIESSMPLPYNQHKKVSISTQLGDNRIIIGATNVKDNPTQVIDNEAPEKLLKSASDMIDFGTPKILELRAGVRPSSRDYLPLCGNLIDIEKTYRFNPEMFNGRKIKDDTLHRIPGLYIHNGHGARGFVSAPYSALFLAKHIVYNHALPKSLDIKRTFMSWVKKGGKEYPLNVDN